MGWDCVRGVPLNSHDAWSEVWRRCIGNLLRSSISSCQKKVLQLHCESPTSPASPSCRQCKTDQNRNVIWDFKVGFSWSYHHHVTMSCHVTFLVLDIGWFSVYGLMMSNDASIQPSAIFCWWAKRWYLYYTMICQSKILNMISKCILSNQGKMSKASCQQMILTHPIMKWQFRLDSSKSLHRKWPRHAF